jgi:hypothetical protein
MALDAKRAVSDSARLINISGAQAAVREIDQRGRK